MTDLGVPADLVRIVKAYASDDPNRRPANAVALAERLRALLPAPATPSSPRPDEPRPQGSVLPSVAPAGRRDDAAVAAPAKPHADAVVKLVPPLLCRANSATFS